MEEYWIVEPYGKSVEIYYLENGKYVLKENYLLQDDAEEGHDHVDTQIALRGFPHIKMRLKEIFEGIDF